MTEFDALLNEVLGEDARVEVPAGMEQRIALALSEKRRPRFGRRRIWLEALAASILLGLAMTWALKTSRQVVTIAPRPTTDNAAKLRSPPRDSQGTAVVRASIPGRRRWRRPQREALQIAPLELEPLVIRPIEIASLTSRTSTGKGEVR